MSPTAYFVATFKLGVVTIIFLWNTTTAHNWLINWYINNLCVEYKHIVAGQTHDYDWVEKWARRKPLREDIFRASSTYVNPIYNVPLREVPKSLLISLLSALRAALNQNGGNFLQLQSDHKNYNVDASFLIDDWAPHTLAFICTQQVYL